MSTFLTILKAVPSLIRLLGLIKDIFTEARDMYEKSQRKEELDKAVKKAVKEKDTRDLEKFFGRHASKRGKPGK